MGSMKKIRLPNGKDVACIDKLTALYCYHEIYQDNDYIRHGITIRPGDVVFDIGANIGHFTRWAAEHYAGLNLFAFEPVPPVFKALRENVSRLDAEVHLFDFGLAEKAGTADFFFYPRVSADSAMVPVDWPRKRTLLLRHYSEYRNSVLDRLVPRFLRGSYLDLVHAFMYAPRKIACRLAPLSETIRAFHLPRIDLLKLDAENSEEQVLAGIAEEHWPLIRQISMEVHEHIAGGEGLLDRLQEMLESRGFTVHADRAGTFSHAGVHMLYAVRIPDAEGT